MKKILITGANSYIGTSFENYIKQYEGYSVDTLDMMDKTWREYDFSGYDAIFHVAGIVHIKETKKNKELYYKVNRDLTMEVAKRAKNSNVKQFVFLSTMNVYGLTTGSITKSTIPNPRSHYGKSKLQAENLLEKLQGDFFDICIIRPPMVYGIDCKGNYKLLQKWALKLPIFPDFKNKRSVISIDALCKFVKTHIDNSAHGIFLPQDKTYACTSDMVKKLAIQNGHYVYMTKIFNPVICLLKIFNINIANKIFGDLYYIE